MKSSTYHHHLKVGYGSSFLDSRERSFFHIQSAPAEIPKSFKEECIRAAKLIFLEAQSKNKKIVIALSGGLDSEVVARSFLEANVPFEAAILKYLPDLNDHDIQFAFHFCKLNNIKVNQIDIDVFQFYKSSAHRESYELYHCNSPMFSVHLELCRQFKNDFLIFGGVVPIFHIPPDIHNHAGQVSRFNIINKTLEQFNLAEFPVENTFCYDRFFSQHGTCGVSHFFMYTPELILRALAESDVIHQTQSLNEFSRAYPPADFENIQLYHSYKISNQMKHDFFRKMGFRVQPKPSKLTGFEKIHELCYLKPSADTNTFENVKSYQRQLSGLIRFNQLYRKPMEEKLPKLSLGVFDINELNKKWLFEFALENWSYKE
jgi:hypothetical protein